MSISYENVMIRLAAVEDVPSLMKIKDEIFDEINRELGVFHLIKRHLIKGEINKELKDNKLTNEKDISYENMIKMTTLAIGILEKKGIRAGGVKKILETLENNNPKIEEHRNIHWEEFFKYIVYKLVKEVLVKSELPLTDTMRFVDKNIKKFEKSFNNLSHNRGWLLYVGPINEENVLKMVHNNFPKILKFSKSLEDHNPYLKSEIDAMLNRIMHLKQFEYSEELTIENMEKGLSFLGDSFIHVLSRDNDDSADDSPPTHGVSSIPRYIIGKQIKSKLNQMRYPKAKDLASSIEFPKDMLDDMKKEFKALSIKDHLNKLDISFSDIIGLDGDKIHQLVNALREDKDNKGTFNVFDRMINDISSINSGFKSMMYDLSEDDFIKLARKKLDTWSISMGGKKSGTEGTPKTEPETPKTEKTEPKSSPTPPTPPTPPTSPSTPKDEGGVDFRVRADDDDDDDDDNLKI